METASDVPQLIEHLFRHQSGKMLAVLTRLFGAEYLQLAEDVVQETLVTALKTWPYRGIPPNPPAWLMQVAKNKTLDILRREAKFQSKLPLLLEDSIEENEDDELTMLFMGCHPALTAEMQAALLLKTLGGFSVAEIARAFLLPEPTIAQRIVRAKRKIRDEQVDFSLPSESEQESRLNSVLLVIYLLFNEGYKASEGVSLIRKDLAQEAIRLCGLLLRTHQRPDIHALMALMLLQGSRLEARSGDELLLLSEQDRKLWDRQAIHAGLYHLQAAATGESLSLYHLQAGIAACHALALSYEETDWAQIVAYYQQWLEIAPSPIVKLNFAAALSFHKGAELGLEELSKIEGLEDYYLYHATKGELASRLEDKAVAKEAYQVALELCLNAVERRFLERKLSEAY
jgi:RNA polymerase sigma factor (sigma-70 family)